ncbi:hypothetical protein J3E71DRAFT_244814 [Bipolaris maydis]|nr:hypothetical protein J3E71DRAFT_244814 [Bipolaris maydis]
MERAAVHDMFAGTVSAADFSLNSGIGIGFIQSTAKVVGPSFTLPTEVQAHGIDRGQFRAKNLKTRGRAHMFALILAMGLAHSTIRRKCSVQGGPLDDQKYPSERKATVEIRCSSLNRRRWGRRRHGESNQSKDDSQPQEEEVAPSPSSRTTNHVNAETAGDEEEDGGSDVEGNGVDDGKKGEMIAHIWNMR